MNFSSLDSPKKNWRRKIYNKLDREPVVVFIQKSDKSDQEVPGKLDLEMKHNGMSRTENEIILTCPCANTLRSALLQTITYFSHGFRKSRKLQKFQIVLKNKKRLIHLFLLLRLQFFVTLSITGFGLFFQYRMV